MKKVFEKRMIRPLELKNRILHSSTCGKDLEVMLAEREKIYIDLAKSGYWTYLNQ